VTGSPPALAERLSAYRQRFSSDGPKGFVGVASVWDEASKSPPADDDALAQGQFYELLGYDALCVDRPGWAYVCLRACQLGYSRSGRTEDVARIRDAAQAVLEAYFPPYDDDLAVLADIRRWLWARAAQVAAIPGVEDALRAMPGAGADLPDPVKDRAVALKHRWLFRLVRTRQVGRVFRMDEVFARFPLGQDDPVVLRVLAAAHGDRLLARVVGADRPGDLPLTIGWLSEILAEQEDERIAWLRRFESRAPLRRFGLVYVEPTATFESALRDRRVQIDESVAATIQGRDGWPLELDGLAEFHAAPEHGWSTRVANTVASLEALSGAGRVHLRASSAEAALDVVRAWSVRRARGAVITCTAEAVSRPDVRRAVARHARLRGAVVLLSGDPADAAIEALVALLDDPLVHHHDRASGWPIGVVHEPPRGDEVVLAWNIALADVGLAELAPHDIRQRLEPLGLDDPDIRAVASTVRAHGPKVPVATLEAVAHQLGIAR